MEPCYLLIAETTGKNLLFRGFRCDLATIADKVRRSPRCRNVVLTDSLPRQGPYDWRPVSRLLPTLQVTHT